MTSMEKSIPLIIISILFYSQIYSQTTITAEELLKNYYSAICGENKLDMITDLNISGAFIAKSEASGSWMVSGKYEEIKTQKNIYGFLASYNNIFSQVMCVEGNAYFFPGSNSDYFFMEVDRPGFINPIVLSKIILVNKPSYLSSTNQYQMEILNEDSVKCNVFFNAVTFLLDQICFDYRIKVLSKSCAFSYTFSDYKDYYGFKFPYKISKTVSGLGSVDYYVNQYDKNHSYTKEDFQNPQKTVFKLAENKTASASDINNDKLVSPENEKAVSEAFSTTMKEAVAVTNDLVGKPVSSFSLNDVQNRSYSNKDLIGKITLIDLWATWCKPCVESLPFLETINNSFSKDFFQLWSISTDAEKKTLTTFLGKNKIPTWSMLHDPELKTKDIFKIDMYPAIILVDKKGIIRYIYLGKGHEAETALKISSLINEK